MTHAYLSGTLRLAERLALNGARKNSTERGDYLKYLSVELGLTVETIRNNLK